ncbi:MAG: hypothetical protein IKZ54_10160 [Bacteroidales bacterium]|nr:hypothetical protein [Bacteroidales bacterium]
MFPFFREKVRTRGSRRGEKVRAKGLDGSPRNGEMSRTGVREGLKRKCFWHEGVCDTPVHVVFVGANNYSPLRKRMAKNIVAESPTARREENNVSQR